MDRTEGSIFDRPLPFIVMLVSANIALGVLLKLLFVVI